MRAADVLMRILAPEAGVGAYNDWRLVSTTSISTPILVALGIGLLVALAISIKSLSRLPLRRRLILSGLRAMAAIWVMLLVLKPAVELRAVSRVRTRVALLADG